LPYVAGKTALDASDNPLRCRNNAPEIACSRDDPSQALPPATP
jgi:hypothetical protein